MAKLGVLEKRLVELVRLAMHGAKATPTGPRTPPPPRKKGTSTRRYQRLSAKDAAEIRAAYEKGDATVKQLAEKHKTSLNTVYNIVRGRSWAQPESQSAA